MSLLFAVDISSSINFLNVFLHYSICIDKNKDKTVSIL
jgi:hypothetical protein